MVRSCPLIVLALALVVTPASASSKQTGHLHHLLKAEKDLHEAKGAIAKQEEKKAHHHVASAIHEVEEAIHHHHTNHIATQTSTNTPHHKHHELLKRALSELRVAEKELHAGSFAQAHKEIEKAEKTIREAIASHHNLFGKQ
jgi:hypothetical protein